MMVLYMVFMQLFLAWLMVNMGEKVVAGDVVYWWRETEEEEDLLNG